MSTATETRTEVEEIQALRIELEDANEKIEKLERDIEELEDDAPNFDIDWVEARVRLFADPANWTQRLSDDKYVWSPYMAATEQDPTILANQILDALND